MTTTNHVWLTRFNANLILLARDADLHSLANGATQSFLRLRSYQFADFEEDS